MRSCLAFLVCTMMAVSVLPAQSKGPLIEFQKTNVDRGTIIQGEPIKEVFGFVNRGSGTLEIHDVEHS